MLQLPLVLLLRAQAQPDEPAPFLFGNLSFPLEVLNASQKELLATSDHRRRLGTCHPAADPKNHKRPECRDYATRKIVLEGISREDCLCADGNGVKYTQDLELEYPPESGIKYTCPWRGGQPGGECRDRATKKIVLTENGGFARDVCECFTDDRVITTEDSNPTAPAGLQFTCRQRFWRVIDRRRYWVEVGDPFLPAYNSSNMKPGICSPGHFFKCSDAPCCWGTCDGTDINRYYRCYRKKVCIDPGCGCKCGPCWNSHVDCDQTADAAHCNPPTLYPRRYAGCCCEDCECEDNYASPRVDGCCTCKHCPPGEASDGRSLQCTLDSSATAAAPTAGLLVVAAVLAVYAV